MYGIKSLVYYFEVNFHGPKLWEGIGEPVSCMENNQFSKYIALIQIYQVSKFMEEFLEKEGRWVKIQKQYYTWKKTKF